MKREIKELVRQGKLDADVVFVSKYFHTDYDQLEKNLRPVLKYTLQRHFGNVVLVYGDLCLGPNGEMKELADQYGVVKVDAVNCVDCILGGKGRFLEADPDHDLMFFGPGMTEFFKYAKEKMLQEHVSEDAIKNLFSGLRGIVYLDTLGESDNIERAVQELDTGLPFLEIRKIGLEPLRRLLQETVERSKAERGCQPSVSAPLRKPRSDRHQHL